MEAEPLGWGVLEIVGRSYIKHHLSSYYSSALKPRKWDNSVQLASATSILLQQASSWRSPDQNMSMSYRMSQLHPHFQNFLPLVFTFIVTMAVILRMQM